MKIAQKYSHLNGEEYLIVHHNNLYQEIVDIITNVDASVYKTKISKERRSFEQVFYSPVGLNQELKTQFNKAGWNESRYSYYVTTDRALMQEALNMSLKDQKEFLKQKGNSDPIMSYNQTDFVKDKIAVEVQFGKYSFVAYDLFVKHMMFYSGGVINLGIEILPTKALQAKMSSGIAYFEGEVYNVLRNGRGNPPVPLLIIGVEP